MHGFAGAVVSTYNAGGFSFDVLPNMTFGHYMIPAKEMSVALSHIRDILGRGMLASLLYVMSLSDDGDRIEQSSATSNKLW